MTEKFQYRYWKFRVHFRINPKNSRAMIECVNIFIILIEYTAKRNTALKPLYSSQSKPCCYDSGMLSRHHDYYTTLMTSRWLSRHHSVSRVRKQPIGNRNHTVYESWKIIWKIRFVSCILCIYNNYSMSPSWIWSDKITNERVARVGYNYFISNKGEWNNCFSKLKTKN